MIELHVVCVVSMQSELWFGRVEVELVLERSALPIDQQEVVVPHPGVSAGNDDHVGLRDHRIRTQESVSRSETPAQGSRLGVQTQQGETATIQEPHVERFPDRYRARGV